MTETERTRRSIDWALAAVLGFALIVRLVAAIAFPSLHHPDENFQWYEAAHRLAFGYGVGTWEEQVGLRSPVIPYLLATLFVVAEPIFGGPRGYIYASQIVLAGLSLIVVAAVYRMGLRTSRTHALILGIVAATWFEIVYFSYRPLTEAVAFNFLVASLALSSVPQQDLTWRRLLLIGFCMGLALMLRFQLLPGIVFLALWLGRLDFRERWAPLVIGGLAPVLVFGGADWIAWGGPFHSYITNVRINLLEGKASEFGTQPFLHYLGMIADTWTIATLMVVALAAFRLRSFAAWIGVALCIILSHSLIPHKEYRFIFPATALLVMVAAMSSADLIETARARYRPRTAKYLAAGGVAFWVALSAYLASAEAFASQWYRGRDLINAQYWVAAQQDLCGIAMYDRGIDYGNSAFDSGGYAFLHRDVPLRLFGHQPDEAKGLTETFNYIVLARSSINEFAPKYRLVKCNQNVCVLKRRGACGPPRR